MACGVIQEFPGEILNSERIRYYQVKLNSSTNEEKEFVEPRTELDLPDSNEQCCNKVEQIDGLIKIGEHGLIKVEVCRT